MRLRDDEKAMLAGDEGPAVQKAMDLLVRYGEALDAECLVDTRNVAGTIGATTPFLRQYGDRHGGMDAVFSEFNLDSAEVVKIPKVKVFSSHLQQGIDPRQAERQGIDPDVVRIYDKGQAYSTGLGVQPLNTCTPYQVGNVPIKGEHCAWMESSAVIYVNSVLGARTNAEGRESTGAAMLTGKIPYWGLHLPENRLASHLIQLDIDVSSTADWGLLGYWVGEQVQDRIPLIEGMSHQPNLARLKHFGAAAASSGGVEMYHLLGITPEARTREEAFGSRQPEAVLRFGEAERRWAYEQVNITARDAEVDFIMLGCPHYSLEQLWEVCQLLEGQRLSANTELWIFTAASIKHLADQAGYTRIIEQAGGHVMTDTCSAIGKVVPKGTRVAAVDSAKQAHYLPAIMGIQAWFGTTAECIQAAIDGRWAGVLK